VIFFSSFVNLFSAGLSNTKDILFLLFAVILGVLFLLRLKYSFGLLNRYKKLITHVFVISVFSGLFFGVGLHVYYTQQYDLPLNQYVVTYNNDDWSSTQLLHNHVVKVGFGLVAQTLSIFDAQNIDVGLAYVDLISPLGGIFLIVMLMVSVMCSFLYVVLEKRTLVFTLFYAVCCFGLIKNVFDGGLFNYEVVPLLAGFVYIMGLNYKLSLRKVLVFFGLLELTTLLLIFNSSENMVYFLMKNQVLVALFVLVTFLLYRIVEQNKNTGYRFGIIVLWLGIVLSLGWFKSLNYFEYGRAIVKENTLITTYKDVVGGDKIGGAGKVHLFSYKNTDSTLDMFTLLHNLDLNYKYFPASSEWMNCIPTQPYFNKQFLLHTQREQELADVNNDLYSLQYTKVKTSPPTYVLDVALSPCLPSSIDLITQEIRVQGVETFWLQNKDGSHVFE
jgi:hypothetical protein